MDLVGIFLLGGSIGWGRPTPAPAIWCVLGVGELGVRRRRESLGWCLAAGTAWKVCQLGSHDNEIGEHDGE